MNPLISVIVPCYNQAQYLDECLQSVYDQTYPNWECLLIDDGSIDNTREILMKWVNRDCRFRYFYKDNSGVSHTRNFGISHSIGEYINFLDSDDIISKEKLELQVKDLEHSEISICDYIRVDDNLNEIEKRYFTPFTGSQFDYEELIINWENKISIPIHTVLFKKCHLQNKIIFNEKLINHEDWIFWLELFYYQMNKVVFNRKVMAFYRYKKISVSTIETKMKEGFLKACDIMYLFFKKNKEKRFMELIIKKKKSIENKKSLKSYIAEVSPRFYNFYKKNVKKN